MRPSIEFISKVILSSVEGFPMTGARASYVVVIVDREGLEKVPRLLIFLGDCEEQDLRRKKSHITL